MRRLNAFLNLATLASAVPAGLAFDVPLVGELAFCAAMACAVASVCCAAWRVLERRAHWHPSGSGIVFLVGVALLAAVVAVAPEPATRRLLAVFVALLLAAIVEDALPCDEGA